MNLKSLTPSCIALFLATLVALPAAVAQLPALQAIKGNAAAATTPPAAAETPEQTRKRLEDWTEEWRNQEAAAAANPADLPAGITENEVADRHSDALLGIFSAESILRSLDTATILRQASVQAIESNAAWKNFSSPGPYSFVLHDELRRQSEAVATRSTAYESAVTMLERELANRQDDLKKTEEDLRRATENAERAEPADKDATAWRLEVARLRLRAQGCSEAMLQQARDNVNLKIATAAEEGELLKRKVAAMGKVVIFPEADIAKLKASSNERRLEIAKELSTLEKEQREAIAESQKIRTEIEKLKASTPESDPARPKEQEARLRMLEAKTESLAGRSEISNTRMRFLSEYLDAQTSRRTVLTSSSSTDRATALVALQALHGRTTAFNSLVEMRRNAALSELQEQEARLTALPADSALRATGELLLTAKRAELDSIERFGQEVSSLRLDVGRWLGDARELTESMTWEEKLRSVGSQAEGWLKRIWNFEVYRYEDKMEVDGQIITVKRGLILAWLIGALLFFFVAHRLGWLIARRLFAKVVEKGRAEQGQAATWRRWAMVVIDIVLLLITLHWLRIPLAAFAFLGGALAIGVGFGTQTLFKNFISGIIVLVERKVRVGDILDVDGIAGTVTSIDTRSSTVRSFDGVEIILPNSLLLENKVTNWTHDTPTIRRVVKVGVAYGSPLRTVSTILAEIGAEHGVVAKSPEPQVVLEDLGPDSLVFALYFWINLRGKTGAMTVASDLRFMIEKRLTEAGISISAPGKST